MGTLAGYHPCKQCSHWLIGIIISCGQEIAEWKPPSKNHCSSHVWVLLLGFPVNTADIFPITGLPAPSLLVPAASGYGLCTYSGRSSSVHCFWRGAVVMSDKGWAIDCADFQNPSEQCSKSISHSIILVGLSGFLYWIMMDPNVLDSTVSVYIYIYILPHNHQPTEVWVTLLQWSLKLQVISTAASPRRPVVAVNCGCQDALPLT